MVGAADSRCGLCVGPENNPCRTLCRRRPGAVVSWLWLAFRLRSPGQPDRGRLWHDELARQRSARHRLGTLPDNPGRLLLDIDYILQWVAPEPPATTLSFWISPATLVFDPAWDLITDIDRTGWGFQLFLDAIRRSEPDERGNYDWTLEGDGITIGLGAPGFRSTCAVRPSTAPAMPCPSRNAAVSASTAAAIPLS